MLHHPAVRRTLVLCCASAALGACKGKENTQGGTVDSTATRTESTTTTGTAAGAAAGAGNATMTDPNIVAVLDKANANDSAGGALAQRQGTNADVKAFGKLMVGEHHALRLEGQALAKKLNVTPEPPATDSLDIMAKNSEQQLKSTPKGAQWDKTYIDNEVKMHEAVLSTAQKAKDQAQNAELKQLIERAAPVIQKHLDRAKEIQKKLGSATT